MESSDQIILRLATPDDAEGIIRAHGQAIRDKAAKYYSVEEMAAWAREITPERIAWERNDLAKGEAITYVAEQAGKIIGFATVVPPTNELRAVYVAAEAGRGIGSQLLAQAEIKAREQGAFFLAADASVNAINFYRRHGYVVGEPSMHTLRNGVTIACYKIRKDLLP